MSGQRQFIALLGGAVVWPLVARAAGDRPASDRLLIARMELSGATL